MLDENLPHDLRKHLKDHEVFTISYPGWKGLKNGELLRRAAAAGFDALLTKDAEIEYQQNQASLPIALVVLHTVTNALEDLVPLVPEVERAIAGLAPRTLLHIG